MILSKRNELGLVTRAINHPSNIQFFTIDDRNPPGRTPYGDSAIPIGSLPRFFPLRCSSRMLKASSRVGLGPRFARFASRKGKNDATANATNLVSRPSGLPPPRRLLSALSLGPIFGPNLGANLGAILGALVCWSSTAMEAQVGVLLNLEADHSPVESSRKRQSCKAIGFQQRLNSDSGNDVKYHAPTLSPPMFYSSGSLTDDSIATLCFRSIRSLLVQTTLGLLDAGLLDLGLLARIPAVPLSCRTVGQSTDG